MLRACDGLLPLPVQEKSLPRSPPSASEVASGFRGFEKLRNLSTIELFSLGLWRASKTEKARRSRWTRRTLAMGGSLGMLAMGCSPCLSSKRLFRSSLGMLAIVFSLCLSRKRQFQVSPRRCRSALGLPRLWKFPSLSTSFCFPSGFGELPKSDNPGFRNRIIRVPETG